MADVCAKFAVRAVPPIGGLAGVQGQQWTAVIAPIDCARIVLRNTDAVNAMLIRTDFADPNTQESIPASLEFTIQITSPMTYFKAGETVCHFQPAAGTLGLTLKAFR